MISFRTWEQPSTVEEAWELYQKKGSCLIGGMQWIKMSHASFSSAIDLSALGLCGIEETDKEFVIGCMTPLRELELHPGLDAFSGGQMREALRHIVGVQFRNTATVGGSVAGRFGFSDVLTILLAMNCSVRLCRGGVVPLREYADRAPDRDILTHVSILKEKADFCYQSVRNAQTDFPVLTCAASRTEVGSWRFVYGARPQKALVLEDREGILGEIPPGEDRAEAARRFADYAAEAVPTAKNLRGSAAYRTHLVKVLTERAVLKLM